MGHLSGMTQARENVLSTPRKRASAEEVRNATTGTFVHLHSGDDVTEVRVTKARYGRIANEKAALSKVIAGYADTAAKAKRTGKVFVVTFTVSPNGKIEVVRETPTEKPAAGGSPLDAALARAKGRGATKTAEILKGAEMLTAHEFGELIGTTHTTVNAKRKGHEVLALQGATRGFRYPRWQITQDHLPLPGLVQLFDALGDQPWAVYRFLRAAHAELGGKTALDALRAGQVEAVVGVAANQTAGAFS